MQTKCCWFYQISGLYINFTFNICTDSLPFCHLDDDKFSVAIYELANGTVNFNSDRLLSLKFNPLIPGKRNLCVNYPHLDGLELADHDNDYEGDNIDILISKDHYWDFVTGGIIRGDDGPRATINVHV